MITFDDLIPAQQEVADLTVATALVLGGAGVGKTTAALWAARRDLTHRGVLDRPIPGGRVLFVTSPGRLWRRSGVGRAESWQA
jgi:DNA helicase II / ATP-dependent DNA helicase PcrA